MRIVAWCGSMFRYAGVEVGVDLVLEDGLTLFGRHIHVLEHVMDEPAKQVGVLQGKAEHADDHPR